MIPTVNLQEKCAQLPKAWVPMVVGELNQQYVKVARFEGEYVWHHHEEEDELFLVISGRIRIELRDGTVTLEPGEFAIVPKGVEHRPVAEVPGDVLLFEPKATRNTGNVDHEFTIEPEDLQRL